MSGSWKYLLMLLVAVIGGYYVLQFVFGLVIGIFKGILSIALPILIVGGIAYVLYTLVNRRALSGGTRRTLP